jgi:hypothetical protein
MSEGDETAKENVAAFDHLPTTHQPKACIVNKTSKNGSGRNHQGRTHAFRILDSVVEFKFYGTNSMDSNQRL